MKYVRIQSRLNGVLLADHLYAGDNHVKAIEAFRKEYPEHEKCVITAKTVDDEDPNLREYFSASRHCGTAHFFY